VIRLPFASKLELLDFCAFWPLLPKDPWTGSEKASTGKLTHSLIEQDSLGGVPESDEFADPVRANKLFAKWKPWFETYKAGRIFWPEVAILYNADTGAVRLAPDDWAKAGRPRADNETGAIIDSLHVAPDLSSAEILDWKTGRRTTPAEKNAQMALGALCVMKLFNVPIVRVGLVYLFVRKEPHVDMAELNSFDLLDFEDRTRKRMLAIAGSQPTPGDWCFRCPSKGSCPAIGLPKQYEQRVYGVTEMTYE
jgi:hypothetical protein